MATTKRIPVALLVLAALMLTAAIQVQGVPQTFKEGILYFKQKVKIPFALQGQPQAVKAGEYLMTIRSEGGQPLLTLQDAKGEPLLRTQGEYDEVPFEERKFKEGRLRLKPMPDPRSPGSRYIFLTWDFINEVGNYVRIKFRIPEASEAKG